MVDDNHFLPIVERDLFVKRLAVCGLPNREIVWYTGASSRTVSRILQRFGIQRKRFEKVPKPKKRQNKRLLEILTQYYAIQEITLDSLEQLARKNGLPLKNLLDLIRTHVSPSRWAIRTCLACAKPALTSSPSDRYCPVCKARVKKTHDGVDEDLIYG